MARLLVAPDPSGRFAHLERTAAHAEGGADRAPDTVLGRSPCKLKGSNMTESPPKRARTMPPALKEEIEKSMPEIGEIEYHTKARKKGPGPVRALSPDEDLAHEKAQTVRRGQGH